MMYEITYAREMRTCVRSRMVVIPIHSRTLERIKMSYYTNRPTIYREGEYVVRNYTEDQAGMDIWDQDVLQAANGMYYMTQEIETWKVKNTQDVPTYGNCNRCYQSGPVGT